MAKSGGQATQAKAGGSAKSKDKDKAKSGFATDEAPRGMDGMPRLREYYQSTVREKLQREFGLTNVHQIPTLVKVVLNVGLGEAAKNPKQLDVAADELALITGQKAVITRAKKAIANFGLRAGMPVGCAVTLRGARMWEFLDRFITVTVPRMRDFRGLSNRSFDGRGNYTFGVKEQMIFPEVDFDKVENIHGMDITIVTSADRDDLAMALLRELGWPFKGELPQRVA